MADTPYADLVAAVIRYKSESFAFSVTDIDAEVASRAAALVDAFCSVDEIALNVLLRLSEQSDDGRLRDAIALVRSALHDQVERSAKQ